MTVPKTGVEWQALLDEKFPQGAIVSPVLRDETLSGEGRFLCPLLFVIAMRGEWPLIVGIAAEGRDIQLHTASWAELDREGHYAARTQMAPVVGARRGEYEISSKLSPKLIEVLAPYRDPQREWLQAVVDSTEVDTSLELDTAPEDDPARAPSAQPSNTTVLTLTHV